MDWMDACARLFVSHSRSSKDPEDDVEYTCIICRRLDPNVPWEWFNLEGGIEHVRENHEDAMEILGNKHVEWVAHLLKIAKEHNTTPHVPGTWRPKEYLDEEQQLYLVRNEKRLRELKRPEPNLKPTPGLRNNPAYDLMM